MLLVRGSLNPATLRLEAPLPVVPPSVWFPHTFNTPPRAFIPENEVLVTRITATATLQHPDQGQCICGCWFTDHTGPQGACRGEQVNLFGEGFLACWCTSYRPSTGDPLAAARRRPA